MMEIIMRNQDLREFCVWGNLPSPIQQVRVPTRHSITQIRSITHPIRQVVPLMARMCSYPPHHSDRHPPSHSFSSTALPSLQNPKSSHPSLSAHVMMISWHRVQHTPATAYTRYSIHQIQHTPDTAYTRYSIHRVQHTPNTAYTKYTIHRVQHIPRAAYTKYSIHRVQHPPKIVCVLFILMSTSWPQNAASASCLSPYTIDRYLPALHECSMVKSPCHIPTVAF